MSPDQREIARLFLRFFLGTSMVVAALGWAHYGNRLRESDQALKAAGANTLHAIETRMHETLDAVASDLWMLGRLEETSRAFAWRDLNRLTREFLALGAERKVYDRIRYIDERGQEAIRVDLFPGQPRAMPADLQNQSGHHFFRRAMALGPREIHVAPMDLKVEGGEIELPHKPLLRFATPVFDGQGGRRGVVVLDYAASRLLDVAADVPRDSPGQVSLLNRDGYWLHAPRSGDEWAFMFPERRDISFAARYPEAWRAMERAPRGEYAGNGSRFFFTTVAAVTPAPEATSPDAAGPPEEVVKVPSPPPCRANTGSWCTTWRRSSTPGASSGNCCTRSDWAPWF